MQIRALIIDDNPSNGLVAEFILEELGIASDCIHDAMKTLAQLRTIHYDLLMLDWMMPQIDGIDLLADIRADEVLKSLPVIMCTARSSTQDRQRALSAGADMFLIKPITLEKVQKALNQLNLHEAS